MQRTYPHGVTCWVDTQQPDTDAATRFYGGLFGWTFEDAVPADAPGSYLIAKLDGMDVAAIAPGEGRPAWNTYVAVDDADAAAAAVTAAGGTVVSGPEDAGPGGRTASCLDPAGAAFRLWQARRRPGVQVTNAPGAWNFSDLHTRDPAVTEPFYAGVFGWETQRVGEGDWSATMLRVPGYGDHLAATVDPGIHERQAGDAVPPGFADAIGWVVTTEPGEAVHWHVTFTVADRDESVATARRLGAEVLASNDTMWTRDALIRDPQGAELTVSQFTPPG
jgi:predicted enzyme related to lactoylglutathione lyase